MALPKGYRSKASILAHLRAAKRAMRYGGPAYRMVVELRSFDNGPFSVEDAAGYLMGNETVGALVYKRGRDPIELWIDLKALTVERRDGSPARPIPQKRRKRAKGPATERAKRPATTRLSNKTHMGALAGQSIKSVEFGNPFLPRLGSYSVWTLVMRSGRRFAVVSSMGELDIREEVP